MTKKIDKIIHLKFHIMPNIINNTKNLMKTLIFG